MAKSSELADLSRQMSDATKAADLLRVELAAAQIGAGGAESGDDDYDAATAGGPAAADAGAVPGCTGCAAISAETDQLRAQLEASRAAEGAVRGELAAVRVDLSRQLSDATKAADQLRTELASRAS
jgi:hypothetical protein